MSPSISELMVITKAKDLCSYIMIITQKSPKHFRFTFVIRLQNLALDIIENLYRANAVFSNKENPILQEKRLNFQHQAMTNLKLLNYFSLLSLEQGCILAKQFEQISIKSTECINTLGSWINSDRKRLQT